MSKREVDLGRLVQKVGRRIEDEGQAASQRFHDWKREPKMPQVPPPCSTCDGTGKLYAFGGIGKAVPCGVCGGSGDSARLNGGNPDGQKDREAARLSAEWLVIRLQLESLANRAAWIMDQAKADKRPLDKHRTPAQVEADGWCGSHWKSVRALVAITKRPSGEAYYKGRCRFCGSWPGGDPPADVLRTRVSQRAAAS